MSGPIVRLVAQVVLVGVNIVTKAFMQAYQQAKAGGGSAGKAAKSVSTAGRMPLDQARQILNLDVRAPLSRDEIMRAFTRYYEANDAEKGGSFYVQSKIWSAKEALIDDVRRTQAQSEKEQPTADRATKDSTVGDRFSDADAEHYRDLRQQQPSRVFYSESNATSAYVFDGSTAHGIFRGRRLSWPAADRTSVVLQ